MNPLVKNAIVYIAAGTGLIALCVGVSTAIVLTTDKLVVQPTMISELVGADEITQLPSGQSSYRGKIFTTPQSEGNSKLQTDLQPPIKGASDFRKIKLNEETWLVSGGTVKSATERPPQTSCSNFYFDTKSHSYKAAPSLIHRRTRHTLLKNGRMLVIGGTSDDNFLEPLEILELIDPKNSSCNELFLTTGRLECAAIETAPGKVLLVGGEVGRGGIQDSDSIELVDLEKRESKVLGYLRKARSGAAIEQVSAKEFLVLGGYAKHQWNTDSSPQPPELIKLP